MDLSGTRIAVALWGSFAMKLNTYISQHNNDTAPVIILLRQPQVGNCFFGSRLHINDDMPQILEFKSNLNVVDTNVESSSRTSQLNSDTVVANPEDYYLLTKNDDDVDAGPFHCDGCGFVSDVFGKIRIVVRVQDESGSSSFVLFECHVKDLIHRGNQWLMDKIAKNQGRQQIPNEFNILLNKKFVFKVQISMFNLQNNYRAYTVHKLTDDDERVLAEVTKRSPNHQHDNINDNGTPINKPNKVGKCLIYFQSQTRYISSDMPMEKVDYDYYNIELFSSTTWQWREFQNIRLPSSVYPVSDEAVTSGGAVYFLLSNDTILRFDIYSEEHILIFAPSTINELKPYASRLIKFHGKLGYLSISGDSSWVIWIFIHNQWVKVDDSTYNESAHEW
ncbi:unnamed protein product [Lactuca saligna]|uniref:F-box associated beta-propeller type 3 domain-containing protein n=1 Tax=Lactuca saligna TaxID=75948 RepID=A0AA35V8L3_LACSI|nr:unnamed protein product [Lactuca saligna]